MSTSFRFSSIIADYDYKSKMFLKTPADCQSTGDPLFL